MSPRVELRALDARDWPLVHPFFAEIVSAGHTYAYPEGLGPDESYALWTSPGHAVVAVDGERILGTASMGTNRPGRGAHVATGSFMVDPAVHGRGVGRALGEYLIDWARRAGYRGIQFNAVVQTNAGAVHLWQSLGFEIVGTVPEAFDDAELGLVGLHVMYLALRATPAG